MAENIGSAGTVHAAEVSIPKVQIKPSTLA